jgi:hypothetical protein
MKKHTAGSFTLNVGIKGVGARHSGTDQRTAKGNLRNEFV